MITQFASQHTGNDLLAPKEESTACRRPGPGILIDVVITRGKQLEATEQLGRHLQQGRTFAALASG
ncbi:hypothetical protein [Azonexus sp.]|uniref:hypothetical protein n=1 Tax=Azonexus sp. TaxID=1872668 RepID=UPI0035B32BB6